MPQFILLCRDMPDSLALRMATRPSHLEYFHGFGNKLMLGGPLLNDKGEPAGSMLIVDAESEAQAHDIAANDPYQIAGLFKTVEIIPFKTAIANFPEG